MKKILILSTALSSLAFQADATMRDAARAHGRMALARAEKAMHLPEDLAHVRDVAAFALRD